MSKTSSGSAIPSPEGPGERRDGERSEPSRNETGPSGGAASSQIRARPSRRHFSAEYKLRILEQADACRAPGEVGSLLRREGLYHGHLSKWRAQRKQGALHALRERPRGPHPPSAEAREIETLRRENARLRRDLEKAQLCLDIQKKASEMLGIRLNSLPSDGSDS